ncbi:site-specific integrase [Acinetobacter albensis]|uniref:site-specific integrase n=1 Tax=Acinetobacter albensis TaxID=1673609 RepID=UPI001880C3B8|nr:site-specific integrase [Acinetobacter albensis]MBE9400468.1 site-specific integrase [Acinetobacter albensis]
MKIPKAIQRGDSWRICVNFQNKRHTSTHDTEKEAKEWAARKILELKDASKSSKDEIPQHTYLEAIEYYLKNVTPKKKGARWETLRFRKLIRDNPQLVSKNLLDLKSFDFVKYRDSRIKYVTATTVSREMELLSAVLYCCIRELGWLSASPMTLVARPKLPPPRNRRAYDHEIAAILEACSYKEGAPVYTKSQEVGWSVLFALETAMRMGEITSMTWDNVYIDKMYVHLPDTKNGLTRNIPLSEKAEQLLLQIKGANSPRVLSIESDSLSTLFRKYRNRCEIDDLRFHDLRHEATTRMAQIIQNPADLSKITGHTDINILVNTYYNPTPTEVALRLRKGGVK